MGVDIPYVDTVIHIGPPSTMEMYMQQIGRGGRSRRKANAILFWNNINIGTNISHMTEEMRRYCRSKECLREQLVRYFGFTVTKQNRCCSTCEDLSCSKLCEKLSAMDLPKIVRRAPMSHPLLVRDLDRIIAQWNPDQAVINLFEVQPLAEDLSRKIADDFMFITGVDYLFDNYGMWDPSLAHEIFDCITKHTSV